MMDCIEKDVLVVGGGGAAGRAAIEASDAGANVILATKGKFGSSGTTAYAVADFAGVAVADGVEDPSDTSDLHFKDTLQAGLGMCDARLSRILVEESLQVVPDLERWGGGTGTHSLREVSDHAGLFFFKGSWRGT